MDTASPRTFQLWGGGLIPARPTDRFLARSAIGMAGPGQTGPYALPGIPHRGPTRKNRGGLA